MSGPATLGRSSSLANGCSIVIVTYYSNPYIEACLNSIVACGLQALQVVVVDNGGTSIPTTPLDLVVHRSSENLGFGRAVNLGVDVAKYDTILILNPDTLLFADTLPRALAKLFSTDRPTIVGAVSRSIEGNIRPGFKGPLPSFAHLLKLALGAYQWRRQRYVDVSLSSDEHLAGCFLLMRRSTWQMLGGFDPRYFLYFEDADMCTRARRSGIDCVISEDIAMRHEGGTIPREDTWKIDCFARSGLRYLSRHWTTPNREVGQFLIFVWWGRRRFQALLHRLMQKALRAKFRST